MSEQTGDYLAMGGQLEREFILRFPPTSHQSLPHGMSNLLHFWLVSLTLKKSEIMPFHVKFFSGYRSGGKLSSIPGTLPLMEHHT